MLDNTKIFIIDFEDSFTFNIANVLYEFETNIKVVSHLDFFVNNYLKQTDGKIAVILGPGPGSPDLYFHYFSLISEMKNNDQIFLMGICLGHQILGMMDGFVVKLSNKPIHGGQVVTMFNSENILVQRYNSLAIFESNDSETEINFRHWTRGISYQFHPESVGTENQAIFFRDLVNFIL